MEEALAAAVALFPEHAVCLVLGGAGFIGSHVAAALKRGGRRVAVADRQPCLYRFEGPICDNFVPADLRDPAACRHVFTVAEQLAREAVASSAWQPSVWVFLFAADMGGMGYIESHESELMLANTAITANVVEACCRTHVVERLFLASSACVYPLRLQDGSTAAETSGVPIRLCENMAWPAQPADGYGLEKLYGEELALRVAASVAAPDNPARTMQVRIARFHNVYGPRGTWLGGREKAPAAFLRKALCLRALEAETTSAATEDNGSLSGIEVWGDGNQMRSFCHINDAVLGVLGLMTSSVCEPINLGSDEALAIRDLAVIAGTEAGYAATEVEERFIFDSRGPEGVRVRNADLSLALAKLGWKPRVPLAEGLRRTRLWMEEELDGIRAACLRRPDGGKAWIAFLKGSLTSQYKRADAPRRFALLLPITSRGGREVELEKGLRAFLQSLAQTTGAETCAINTGSRWQYDLVFGVDAGDPVCDPDQQHSLDLINLIRSELPLAHALGIVTVRVRVFQYPAGSVCRIWSDLASECFMAGCDLAVLLGDDVRLRTQAWADQIWAAFESISDQSGLPFGFGCVAFADDAFPGFPTFPVLHRLHAEVFSGRIFPTTFRNQDADPFLFQVYRAFNAARIEPKARLANTIGGAGDARYNKQPHVNWTGATLGCAREAASHWLALRQLPGKPLPAVLTLDVVVPTYRVTRRNLEAILSLPVPPDVSVQFTIVNDRPDHPPGIAVLADMLHQHRDNPMVRIRSNPANLGAGPSRNRGLAESAADWTLFLDDDVEPDQGILQAYATAIRAHPFATGFVGLSQLPPPATARQAGVILAGVSFFWTAAQTFPTATELPWGVTANICLRRPAPGSGVAFSDAFPRTGGGEDIDYCLRLREYVRRTIPQSEGLVAVPDAIIRHPWWDHGEPHYGHFGGWAYGDGHLIDLYPKLTYRNLPDLSETLLLLAAIALMPRPAPGPAVMGWAAAACVVADFSIDLWREFCGRRAPHNRALAALPARVRLIAVMHGVAIRTVSESSRLCGHLVRGRLLHNFGRRFNWFGEMWDGAPRHEQWQALWRTVVRGVSVATALSVRRWMSSRQ